MPFVMQSEALCFQAVCMSVCIPQTLAQYPEKYRTYFRQTFSIGAFYEKGKWFKFWSQKVKVQCHSGVQHAGKCTFLALLTRYLEIY